MLTVKTTKMKPDPQTPKSNTVWIHRQEDASIQYHIFQIIQSGR